MRFRQITFFWLFFIIPLSPLETFNNQSSSNLTKLRNIRQGIDLGPNKLFFHKRLDLFWDVSWVFIKLSFNKMVNLSLDQLTFTDQNSGDKHRNNNSFVLLKQTLSDVIPSFECQRLGNSCNSFLELSWGYFNESFFITITITSLAFTFFIALFFFFRFFFFFWFFGSVFFAFSFFLFAFFFSFFLFTFSFSFTISFFLLRCVFLFSALFFFRLILTGDVIEVEPSFCNHIDGSSHNNQECR